MAIAAFAFSFCSSNKEAMSYSFENGSCYRCVFYD
jgi:hypothetical protein